MQAMNLLRRLAEQHEYKALREACLEVGTDSAGTQVLAALADAHLGEQAAAQCALAALDQNKLTHDTRVDAAAVHMALGEIDHAVATLEAARCHATRLAHTTHALLLARLAWCRLQQGQPDTALPLYEQSLTLKPMIAVYHQLLSLYLDTGRLAAMEECLTAAQQFWTLDQAGWPDDQRQVHSRNLRERHLDLWLDQGQDEAAEAWVSAQQRTLREDDWCELLCAWATRLSARYRHAQAEEWLRRGLGHYPEHADLYAQLAELAQAQGRVPQAAALLRRAIQVAKAGDQPVELLWIRLSTCILQTNPSQARQAALQAQAELSARTAKGSSDGTGAQRPVDAGLSQQIELALAAAEAQEQDYSGAEQRYQRLLEQHPRMVGALQGLGDLRMQLGQIDDAVALFERVKAIDPARGHGSLINARRYPEDEGALQRLERLARTPNAQGTLHTGLLFQIAAAWEQREDYDRAFALAEEANETSRQALRYDKQAHRNHCARIRYAFPKTLYEHRPNTGHESTLPLFVVGMPRSGTTLVEQILAGHSKIHGAGELGTIPRLIAGLERWERHTGSGRGYPECVDDLDEKVSRGIADNVVKELREYAPEADHVVDKLPHNFENVGLIRLLFPQAKIISVRRDPRDIAISNYFTDFAAKHGGMGFAYDLDWIGEQLADHNLLMHHWQQVFGDSILEIQYEDLVDDPAGTAARMFDYIGVSWEAQVLDFDGLERPIKTASVWQVRQPLYASAKGRWQAYSKHLQPLIAATNREVTWEPIDMVTLQQPGWLNAGVDLYRQGDLDAAEYRFKQLLHHLPGHAAARFMLGLIYLHKGHQGDAIALMAQALECCPWNGQWRKDLAQAYRLAGRDQEAAAVLEPDPPVKDAKPLPEQETGRALEYLYLSEGATCSNSVSATSGTDP
jgi:tetratricopeptide (TPR) repeat protein